MTRYIEQDTLLLGSYLHQKSLYGRFGKPGWRLKLYGGFNHQVVWGHEQDYYTEDYTLTPIETYFYVITGKRYTNGYIQEERQGNHLGSIDLGLEYEFDKSKVASIPAKSLRSRCPRPFGKHSGRIEWPQYSKSPQMDNQGIWNKMLFEFLYTKNQAGQPWSPEYWFSL